MKTNIIYCKTCNRPRHITKKGLCPGCLKHGTIIFDPEINVLKEMSQEKKKNRGKGNWGRR